MTSRTPKKTTVDIGFVAELTVGGNTASFQLEHTQELGTTVIRGGMLPGQQLLFGPLLEESFEITPLESMQNLAITALELEMRPTLKSRSFYLEITDAWSFELKTGIDDKPLSFSIDRILVDVRSSPQEKFFFLLGEFTLFDGPFSLSLTRIIPRETSGRRWTLQAKAKDLKLAPLINQVIGANQLPDKGSDDFGLNDLTIDVLEFEINQGDFDRKLIPEYRFLGALEWNFSVGGEDFAIIASAEISRHQATTTGRLTGTISLLDAVEASIFYEFSSGKNADKEIGFSISVRSNSSAPPQTFGIQGIYKKENNKEIIDFTFEGTFNLGDIISYVVSLFDPSLEDFELDPPWDKLSSQNINLDILKVSMNLTDHKFTFTYNDTLDLFLFKVSNLGLAYERISPRQKKYRTRINLALEAFGQTTTPSWDPVNENPPEIPSEGVTVFDLQFLAIGQRVTFNPLIVSQARSITQVMTVLRQTMGVTLPPAQRRQNPLEALQARLGPAPVSIDPTAPITLPPGENPVVFNASSGILFGAQFSVMDTLDMSVIFNDPLIYGLRISLYGSKAKLFAGLQFEILYRKISDTVGVYHIELALPDAMRNFDVGALSVTLPIVVVDIYTNGDFAIDFGFPWKGDFSRSFMIQGFAGPFPVIGAGGFYFAKLSAETATSTPAITNGNFSPVYEFGLGLKIGLGRNFNKGVLQAEISITIHGVIQGVVARFNPDDPAVATDDYFKIQGGVSLVGRLYGLADFGVISVDVEVLVRATVLFVVEAYQPTEIILEAEVSVRASIKIAFVRIRFKFNLKLRQSFTIGSAKPTPWIEGEPTDRRVASASVSRFAPASRGPISFDTAAFETEALETVDVEAVDVEAERRIPVARAFSSQPTFFSRNIPLSRNSNFVISEEKLLGTWSRTQLSPPTDLGFGQQPIYNLYDLGLLEETILVPTEDDKRQAFNRSNELKRAANKALNREVEELSSDGTVAIKSLMLIVKVNLQDTKKPSSNTHSYRVRLFSPQGTSKDSDDIDPAPILDQAYRAKPDNHAKKQALVVDVLEITKHTPKNDRIRIDLYFQPGFTQANSQVKGVGLLFIENSIPKDDPQSKPTTDTDFDQLVKMLLRWTIRSYSSTGNINTGTGLSLTNWQAIYERFIEEFKTADNIPSFLQDLEAFLQNNFVFDISDRPLESDANQEISGAFFPMLPKLEMQLLSTSDSTTTINFQDNTFSLDHIKALKTYFRKLRDRSNISSESLSDGTNVARRNTTTSELSLAEYVFADYFLLLIRSGLQSAIDHLENLEPQTFRTIDEVFSGLRRERAFDEIAGMASRYFLHGLRLPNNPTNESSLDNKALYEATGQQFDIGIISATGSTPARADLEQIVLTNPENLNWIRFIDYDRADADAPPKLNDDQLNYFVQSKQHEFLADLREASLDLTAADYQPHILPFYEPALRRYNLRHRISLQNGELRELPADLRAYLQDQENGLSLTLSQATDKTDGAITAKDTWCTKVKFIIKQIGAGNIYELVGTDETGKDLLEAIRAKGETTTLDLLFLESGRLSSTIGQGIPVSVLKTNLSTRSASSSGAASRGLVSSRSQNTDQTFQAKLSDGNAFLQILWECSTVNSGGYYFDYGPESTVAPLSDDLFTDGVTADLVLKIQVTNHTHEAHPFHNCVEIGATFEQQDLAVIRKTGDPIQVIQLPAGHVGIQLKRKSLEPDEESAVYDLSNLYQLLGYRIAASDDFNPSADGLPIGPNSNDDDDPWLYERVIPVYKFAKATGKDGAANIDSLPADLDPYRGINASAILKTEVEWRDVYGNSQTKPKSPLDNLPVRYFDPLVGLNQWPGLMEQYKFEAGETAKTTTLKVFLQLDLDQYVPKSSEVLTESQTKIQAALDSYRQIFYQVHQDDVKAVAHTSILLKNNKQIEKEDDDKAEKIITDLRNFSKGAYSHLVTLKTLSLFTHTTVNSKALSSIAEQFHCSADVLARENAQDIREQNNLDEDAPVTKETHINPGTSLRIPGQLVLNTSKIPSEEVIQNTASNNQLSTLLGLSTNGPLSSQASATLAATVITNQSIRGIVQDNVGSDQLPSAFSALLKITDATSALKAYVSVYFEQEPSEPRADGTSDILKSRLATRPNETFSSLTENFNRVREALAEVLANAPEPESQEPVDEPDPDRDLLSNQIRQLRERLNRKISLAEVAIAIQNIPLLKPNAPLIKPPSAFNIDIPFELPDANSQVIYPKELIFPVTVQVTLKRDKDNEDLIASDLVATDTPDKIKVEQKLRESIETATAYLSPRAIETENNTIQDTETEGDTRSISLKGFAQQFQDAFPGLRLASSDNRNPSFPGDPNNPSSQSLWAVRMGQGGLTYDILEERPHFFAPAPLANTLMAGTVDLKIVDSDADRKVPGYEPESKRFDAIDLNLLAQNFLQAVEDFLSPEISIPAVRLGASTSQNVDQVLAAKETLANAISEQVKPLLESPGTEGNQQAAADALNQELKINLAEAYALETIVQFGVSVTNPFASSQSNEIPVRLSGQPSLLSARDAGTEAPIALEALDFTLSPAKASLESNSHLTFFFNTQNPEKYEDIELDLAFHTNELEYNIKNLPDIEGYQSSDWLSFIAPPEIQVTDDVIKNFEEFATDIEQGLQTLANNNQTWLTSNDVRRSLISGLNKRLNYGVREAVVSALQIANPQRFAIENIQAEIQRETIESSAADLLNYLNQEPWQTLLSPEEQQSVISAFLSKTLTTIPLYQITPTILTKLIALNEDIQAILNEFRNSSRSWPTSSALATELTQTQILEELLEEKTITDIGRQTIQSAILENIQAQDANHIGHVQIPIPLRTYPIPPSLILQQAQLDPDAIGDDLAKVREWQYVYTYEHLDVAQDTLESDVQYNLTDLDQAAAKNTVEDSEQETLFDALVRFQQKYPDLKASFEALSEGNADVGKIAGDVHNFATLVTDVANKWADWEPINRGIKLNGVDYEINEEEPKNRLHSKEVTIAAPVGKTLPKVTLPGYYSDHGYDLTLIPSSKGNGAPQENKNRVILERRGSGPEATYHLQIFDKNGQTEFDEAQTFNEGQLSSVLDSSFDIAMAAMATDAQPLEQRQQYDIINKITASLDILPPIEPIQSLGYGLKVIALDALADFPDDYTNQVIVAKIGEQYHVRIFEQDGTVSFETPLAPSLVVPLKTSIDEFLTATFEDLISATYAKKRYGLAYKILIALDRPLLAETLQLHDYQLVVITNSNALPTEGKNKVFLNKSSNQYRVRIFDRDGETELDQQQNSSWPDSNLTPILDDAFKQATSNPRSLESFTVQYELIYRITASLEHPLLQQQLHRFVEKSPEQADLDPVLGESSIPDRTLLIQDRDILAHQNAWSGIWLSRNRRLVSDAKTNPLFIFQTPQVRFSNWVTPLLVNSRPWDIADLQPLGHRTQNLETHLTKLFDTVLPNQAPQPYALRLDCRYSFAVSIVGDERLFSAVPVLLTPRIEIAEKKTIERDLVVAIAKKIIDWRNENVPVEEKGRYQLSLNLFSGLKDSTLPLLKIEQLFIKQKDITWPDEEPEEVE